jgi:hypothetical protein
MGLVEGEWIETLATVDPTTLDYRDFVAEGRRLAAELKVGAPPGREQAGRLLGGSRPAAGERPASRAAPLPAAQGGWAEAGTHTRPPRRRQARSWWWR